MVGRARRARRHFATGDTRAGRRPRRGRPTTFGLSLQILEEGERILHGHGHHLDDRLARHRDGARYGVEPCAVARGAGTVALVRLELLAPLVALRLLHHALERGHHALEGFVVRAPGEDEVVVEAVQELVAEGCGQLLPRGVQLHLVLLRDPREDLVIVHDRHVPGAAPGMDAFAEGERLVGDHEILVEVEDGAEPAAGWTRPERRVEGEVARFQLVEGDAAVGAGVLFGENHGRDALLRVRNALHHDDAVAGLKAKFHGIGEAGGDSRDSWFVVRGSWFVHLPITNHGRRITNHDFGDYQAVHHHVD